MPTKSYVKTMINGEMVEFLAEPRQSLLEVLRDTLQLTGSKEGCNDGNCGACTVNMDGRIVCSCLVLGVEAQGSDIETIEGMATPDGLHPLQVASSKMPPSSAVSARPASSSPPRPSWKRTPTQPSTKYDGGWPTTSAAAPDTTRSCAQ